MEKESFVERFWKVRASGSTVRTEILAGVTTFLTMAYIIFVNPATISAPASVDAAYYLAQMPRWCSRPSLWPPASVPVWAPC